jgi:hypothetical protein
MINNIDYLSNLSNSLAASISSQKDILIFNALKDINADFSNLIEVAKNARFIKHEEENFTIFNYGGKDLLQIFDPEVKEDSNKVTCEVKYKKLY